MKRIKQNIIICAIFDGHGGSVVSKYLEDKFCDYLVEEYTKNDNNMVNALNLAI
jgi:serine/threonine protein phosphatase PrpC